MPVPGRSFFDLSHTIEHGMTTLPGLDAPVICDYLSREASRTRYAPGTEFHIGRIDMIANTGTYVDAPFHRYADGIDIADLPIDALADLPAVVVRAVDLAGRGIGPERFRGLEVGGRAVLVHTGWDQHWRTPGYATGFPFLTGDAAAYLADQGAVLVGIDSINIDDMDDGRRPVHTELLGRGIPIAEHLCHLGAVPDHGLRFFAVPAKVRGMGTFPVRAFAMLGD